MPRAAGLLPAGLDLAGLRRSLLAWYRRNARRLPWRDDPQPWAVLVSEMMLQQTQVATVLPYWRRFMQRWPSPRALARAPLDQVLAAWAGLGYYRRARYLHAAAQVLAARGGFPDSVEGLRNLPGLGDYAAAAVASISMGLPVAVVDGNVVRVASRLLALEADPTREPGKSELRAAAQALLAPQEPGDWNQAMMDLGAMVCSPERPGCPLCPLARHCRAAAQGDPEAYPRLPKRAAATARSEVAALALARQGKCLLALVRPRGKGEAGPGELEGYWAFPSAEAEALHPAEQAAGLLRQALGLKRLPPAEPLKPFSRSITRWRISTQALRFVFGPAPAAKAPWQWVEAKALAKRPLAAGEKRILEQGLASLELGGAKLGKKGQQQMELGL
jgi:A/G-specific adenine glycosylase